MIEEPYRWMEAIANRREYVEEQLRGGTPIVALSCKAGVLLLTLARERQKIFEIYDRIAMGAVGHPGDIERLRMAAIEVASTEGFTRSAQDVSLRRLATYSLSPVLKMAFEQVYGAPHLARMLFAELGAQTDFFLVLDYDGTIRTTGGAFSKNPEPFALIAGSSAVEERMREHLQAQALAGIDLPRAIKLAVDTCVIGTADATVPFAQARDQQIASATVEAALLERSSRVPASYRALKAAEIEPHL